MDTTDELYNLPLYYDIAFSWDAAVEIKPFQRYFEKYVPFAVKDILEPACGSGRFLVSLPRYGYHVTGYDNNPKMVEHARKRIAAAGVSNKAQVILGDMRTQSFDRKFDSAICPINSLGHLTSDEDILSHFIHTGDSLKSGGIYIIQMNCASDQFEPPDSEEIGDDWVFERDGIVVKTRWDIEQEDKDRKLSHQVCRMAIDDHGQHISVVDRHTIRLWLFDDLKHLIETSGKFSLGDIYDNNFKQVSRDTRISGELGNLYYILKVL
jgi:SAM-dependent methyltransferase